MFPSPRMSAFFCTFQLHEEKNSTLWGGVIMECPCQSASITPRGHRRESERKFYYIYSNIV